jgi:hypothetical protein
VLRVTGVWTSAFRHEAPAFSDAVIDSLAFKPETLETIAASNELLDRVAANALALRPKDKELAHDLYTDVRDQVIDAAERWRDVGRRSHFCGNGVQGGEADDRLQRQSHARAAEQ